MGQGSSYCFQSRDERQVTDAAQFWLVVKGRQWPIMPVSSRLKRPLNFATCHSCGDSAKVSLGHLC